MAHRTPTIGFCSFQHRACLVVPGQKDSTMVGIEELIVFDVEGTADWRRQKAEEFQNDHRNTDAAEILDRLAVELLL